MTKRYTISAIGISLVAMIFGGCFSDNATSTNSGGHEIGSEPFDYRAITQYTMALVDDSTFLRISTYQECDTSALANYSDTTEAHYAFSGDSLILTQVDWGCRLALLGGTSGQLDGSWKVVNYAPEAEYDDEDCNSNNSTMTFTFSTKHMTRVGLQKDFCWSEYDHESYVSDEYSDLVLTPQGCNRLVATDKDGNQATRTLTYFNEDTRQTRWEMTYNGKSCSMVIDQKEPTSQFCSEAFAAYQQSGSSDEFYWYEWADNASYDSYRPCMEALKVPEQFHTLLSL